MLWGGDSWAKSWRWDIDGSGDTLWLHPPLCAESATLPSIVSGRGDSSRKDLPPDTVQGRVGTAKRAGIGGVWEVFVLKWSWSSATRINTVSDADQARGGGGILRLLLRSFDSFPPSSLYILRVLNDSFPPFSLLDQDATRPDAQVGPNSGGSKNMDITLTVNLLFTVMVV